MDIEKVGDLKNIYPNFFKRFDPGLIPDGWAKVFIKLVTEVSGNLDSFERMELEWLPPTRMHPLGMPSKLNVIVFDLVEDAENAVMGMCEACGERSHNMVIKEGHSFCVEHADVDA